MQLDPKNTKTIIWIVVAILVLLAVVKLFGKFFGKGGVFENIGSGIKSVTSPLGSSDNLDKQHAASDTQHAMNARNGSNNGIVPDSASLSKANTLHDLFDTFHASDVLHLFSTTSVDNNTALQIDKELISGNSGAQIAKIIVSYGTRKVPVREGSANILYDTTYGTLRDHASKYIDESAKFSDGSSVRQHILSYIDKVTKDYLS